MLSPLSLRRSLVAWIFVPVLACVALSGGRARGMFAFPPDVPVERLLKNVGAYVKEHPDDPQGYYTLARVHNLAFTLKSDRLRAIEGRGLPAVGDMFNTSRAPAPGAAPTTGPSEDVLRDHLDRSVENYRKAIAMRPESGLYRLGLASVLERGSTWPGHPLLPPGDGDKAAPLTDDDRKRIDGLIAKLDSPTPAVREDATAKLKAEGPAAMALLAERMKGAAPETRARLAAAIGGYWQRRAAEAYLAAYQRAIGEDAKQPHRPIDGLSSLVSYEAGRSYLRLTEQDPSAPDARRRREEVASGLQKLEKLPPGPITPIVFSFAPRQRRLADLLAPDTPAARVTFDMDGLGRGQAWPWVKPTTGLLAWDPKHTGRIASGRQLFGSVTFFMFWDNGYRALDALDDNRDGKLSGRELDGLAAWFDRDGDGVSGPGEVIPLDELGVQEILTTPAGTDGISPCNYSGLRLRGGRAVATYDWTVTPSRPSR